MGMTRTIPGPRPRVARVAKAVQIGNPADLSNHVGSHPITPQGNGWRSSGNLERVMGIEPTLEAWEAPVLPLNYTRYQGVRLTWARPGVKVSVL